MTFRIHPPTLRSRPCQAIADDVNGGSSHIEQLIHSEQNEDRLRGQADRSGRREKNTSEARETPATPLLVSISTSMM